MESIPIVLIDAPGPLRDRIGAAVPGALLTSMDSVDAFIAREAADEAEWGMVLLGPGVSSPDAFRVLESQKDRPLPWSVLRVEESGGEGFQVRSLSLGVPQKLEEVARMAEAPEEKGPPLELHWVLRVVARARHDLNNPLTAGLAEVQLLLMDAHDPEVTDSLNTIQEQFRRLRDMVADLSRLRVPRKPKAS